MLDGIVDLFSAMAVGLAVAVGLLGLCWCLDEKRVSFFKWSRCLVRRWVGARSLHFILGPLAFVMLYGISVLAQDLTDHLVDSEYHADHAPLAWTREALGGEGLHRFGTLFEQKAEAKLGGTPPQIDPKRGAPIAQSLREQRAQDIHRGRVDPHLAEPRCKETIWYVRGIGREFFRNEALKEVVGLTPEGLKRLPEEQMWFVERVRKYDYVVLPEYMYKHGIRLTNRLYYRAKNWSSRHEVLSGEMRTLQRRIDTSRSLSLVGFATMWFGGVLVLIFVLIVAVVYSENLLAPVGEGSDSEASSTWLGRVLRLWRARFRAFCSARRRHLVSPRGVARCARRLLIVCVAAGLVALSGCVAYARAENNFNERAFGYYSSAASAGELE